MKLSDYPRPPADTGRGVHWSPSQYQWGQNEWPKWRQRILDMGLKWIKVNVPPDYNAEAIVKRLVDIEVMPVCRFIVKNPARIGANIESSIERLVKLGARYFETNNEPDADVEWVGFRRPRGWEQVVVQNLIHDANRIHNLGGIPAFVAFNSGPREPRNPIQILVQTPGGRDLVDRGLWVSLHNYGKGRPFNYPNDRVRMFGDPITDEAWTNQQQPAFWTQEQLERDVWRGLSREHINQLRARQKDPNVTIMTDITCFRAYEYWNQLLLNEGLPSLPIMMTEGGWETDDGIDDFYPQPTAMAASGLNLQMFRFLQGDIDMEIYKPDGSTESSPAPDYLFALMPWHMGERRFGLDTSGQWEQGAWFTHWHDQKYGLNGELPIIQMLRDLPPQVRVNGPTPPEWSLRKGVAPEDVEPWDYRLTYLGQGIRVEQPAGGELGWRVVEGYWQDKDERNPTYPLPPGYIMVKLLDENGNPIPDARVEIHRSDAADVIMAKGESDNFLGNYQMTATLGTYTVRVLHGDHPSARVSGVGLGGEEQGSGFDQTSFLFIFQLKAGDGSQASSSTQPEEVDHIQTETPQPEQPTVQPQPPIEPDPQPVQPAPPVQPVQPAQPQKPSAPSGVDNDAITLGVRVLPPPANAACMVTRVHHYTPEERMAPNTLYLDLVNEAGQRQYDAQVLVKDASGQILQVAIEKPANEPGGNMPMWPGNTYEVVGVRINGADRPAQQVTNLRAAYPGQAEGVAILVALQLGSGQMQSGPGEEATAAPPQPASPSFSASQPEPVINDAQDLGVFVSAPPAGAGCVVTRVHRYTPQERMGPNILYLDLVNQAGRRQYGAIILVQDASGQTLRVAIEKPAHEPGGNIPMWPGNIYRIMGVVIKGQEKPAQEVTNLRSSYPGKTEGVSLLVEMKVT